MPIRGIFLSELLSHLNTMMVSSDVPRYNLRRISPQYVITWFTENRAVTVCAECGATVSASHRRPQPQLRLLHDGSQRGVQATRKADAIPIGPTHSSQHLETNVRAVDLRSTLRKGTQILSSRARRQSRSDVPCRPPRPHDAWRGSPCPSSHRFSGRPRPHSSPSS